MNDQVVSTSSCRNVTIKARTKKQRDYWDSFGTVDVTKAGGWVGSVSFDDGIITDRAVICPSYEGLGKYTVGPADLLAEYEYSDYWGWSTDLKSYVDGTRKSFYIRGKAKASVSAKRSGKYVTLTGKASRYRPDLYGYRAYNPRAKFQVKSGNQWKTVKTVTLKKGKATVKVKRSSKATYRMTFAKTSYSTSATSKSVRK